MTYHNNQYLLFICTTLLLLFSLAACSPSSEPPGEIAQENFAGPTKVIYETDFTVDVDDVGALAVLHALADNGEAEILAVSYNEVQSRAADAIDAINTWYGRGDIPIGLYDKPLADPDYFHSYIDPLAGMANDITDNWVGSSLDLYQRVLSEQPDNSVTIV